LGGCKSCFIDCSKQSIKRLKRGRHKRGNWRVDEREMGQGYPWHRQTKNFKQIAPSKKGLIYLKIRRKKNFNIL
jgi:hypothetical protein